MAALRKQKIACTYHESPARFTCSWRMRAPRSACWGLLTDLLLVPALVHDWKTLGRVHPVYWMAGAALMASQLLRVPLAASPAWHAVAGWVSAVLP